MHKHWPLLVLLLLAAMTIAFSQTVGAVCGDYAIDAGEVCDPPMESGGACEVGVCNLSCTGCTACGDGIKQGFEICDPYGGGDCPDYYFCNYTCNGCNQCGDGVIQAGEGCDISAWPTGCPAGQSCSITCGCTQTCGNGGLDWWWYGEQCDSTAPNNGGCDSGYFCPADCSGCVLDTCGNGLCEPSNGESPSSCPSDCYCNGCGTCGNNAINPSQGEYCDESATPNNCLSGQICQNCYSCTYCGNNVWDQSQGESCDYVGGSPTGCEAQPQSYCDSATCLCLLATCDNDTICEYNENSFSCPSDCGPICNSNSICEPSRGENKNNCPSDCICGDGVKDTAENCDQSATPTGCSAGQACISCSYCSYCGNGFVDPSQGEQCDQSATPNNCDPGFTCQSCAYCMSTGPICGNSQLDAGEVCDDGNDDNYDGCSSTCQLEAGFWCSPELPSVCHSICGDNLVVGTELCDPPNQADIACPGEVCGGKCDSCVPQQSICSNNIIDPGEQCDLPGSTSGCESQPGTVCNQWCSNCIACGNNVLDAGETCDPTAPDNGNCPSGQVCQYNCGACTLPLCTPGAFCESLKGQTALNCPINCYCGDGRCDPYENYVSCPDECDVSTCGNFILESGEVCEPWGKKESIGSCALDEVCYDCAGCGTQLTAECQVIDQPGIYFPAPYTYGNTTGACINITADNVILECGARPTITGDALESQIIGEHADPYGGLAGIGILVAGDNVTVKNCWPKNWTAGILVTGNDAIIISNNPRNNEFGIAAEGTCNHPETGCEPVTGANISGNSVNQNRFGIELGIASYSTVTLTSGTDVSYAILLTDRSDAKSRVTGTWTEGNYSTHNNNIISNSFRPTGGAAGMGISIGYRVDNNTVEGNSFYIPSGVNLGTGIGINGRYNKVVNNFVSGASTGIVMGYASDTLVANNSLFPRWDDGILIFNAYRNTFYNNTVSSAGGFGMDLQQANQYNVIDSNHFINNNKSGIILNWGSNYNNITNNNVEGNGFDGISILSSSAGGGGTSLGAAAIYDDSFRTSGFPGKCNYDGICDAGEAEARTCFNDCDCSDEPLRATINNTISGNIVMDNDGIGISVCGGRGNEFNDNIITTSAANPRFGLLVMSQSMNNVFSGTTIYSKHCGDTGISVKSGANHNTFDTVTIAADWSSIGGGCTDPAVDKGIVLQSGTTYTTILSPRIYDFKTTGIELSGSNYNTIGRSPSSGIDIDINNPVPGSGAIGILFTNAANYNALSGGGEIHGKNGIQLTSSSSNNITGITAVGEDPALAAYGISAYNSNGNRFVNNQVIGSNSGAYMLLNSSHNNILDSNARAAAYSYVTTTVIRLVGSNGNTVSNVNLDQGVNGMGGIKLESSSNNLISGVTPTSLPTGIVSLLSNSQNNTVEGVNANAQTHGIIVQNSPNNILRNLVMANEFDVGGLGAGVLASNSKNLSVINAGIFSFCTNIQFSNTSYSRVTGSNIQNAPPKAGCLTPTSPGTGILTTSGSKYNVFDNNNVVGNSNYGVRFKEAAVYTPVYENITNTNVSGSAVCVYKQNVNNTNISNGNLIQNCPTALIQSNNSGLDPIAFNIFKNSALGIHFNHVLDSEVHDNQFINVAVPILLEGTSGNTFSNNVGSGNGVGIIGMSPADTFTNNVIGELPATTVTCGQTLTTSTKLANSLKCAGNGLTLSGDNIFLACNSKSLTGVRNPTTLQLRGTGVAINGDNDAVSNCNITGFALAVDYGTGTGNVMANNKLSKNAKGVSFINYLLQAFINNDWDP